MLLVGERLDLHDEKLAEIVKALDNVLMSAQVSVTLPKNVALDGIIGYAKKTFLEL